MGLRNNGSVNRVRETLPGELADRVEFLPCQTTVFGALDEAVTGYHPNPIDRDPVVHLNVAFDRAAARFGGGYVPFVDQLADFVRGMDGVAEVRLAAHDRSDERIAVDLRRTHGITVGVDSLYAMHPFEALDVYAASSAVLGMRGHAGMVPFGIGTPIVSLVSHPKLQYFLEDIGHVEWGVPVADPELADRLTALATDRVERQDHYRAEVVAARDGLLALSRDANSRVAAELVAHVDASSRR
jgi:polysaccharide pyruvyl transferase WcaK-like protein